MLVNNRSSVMWSCKASFSNWCGVKDSVINLVRKLHKWPLEIPI